MPEAQKGLVIVQRHALYKCQKWDWNPGLPDPQTHNLTALTGSTRSVRLDKSLTERTPSNHNCVFSVTLFLLPGPGRGKVCRLPPRRLDTYPRSPTSHRCLITTRWVFGECSLCLGPQTYQSCGHLFLSGDEGANQRGTKKGFGSVPPTYLSSCPLAQPNGNRTPVRKVTHV